MNIDIKFKPLMFVEERYINKAIDTANQMYGSLENFITNKQNISNEKKNKLKENYLCSKY